MPFQKGSVKQLRMKINNQSILVYSILLGFAIYFSYGQIKWKNSAKIYCIGYVYDVTYTRNMYYAMYSFRINDEKKLGEQGKGKKLINKHFIVEVVKNSTRMSRIPIQYPVNPNSLVPQPPGGWAECPINEDGSIKEKYKRKSVSGKTEENQKTGIELSAKDSAQVTKDGIEYLKKHKLSN